MLGSLRFECVIMCGSRKKLVAGGRINGTPTIWCPFLICYMSCALSFWGFACAKYILFCFLLGN